METNFLQNQKKFYWFYLAGFFLILALPLLNLPPWFSPPDWGKTIIFRIILSILIFLFIWQILSGRNLSIKTSLPFWILIALGGIYFLATIFSLDIRFSFWGNPSRADGFLNFAFYIIFTILTFLVIRKNDWQKVWDFAIIIGILVSIIAVLQQFGLLSNFFIPFSGRPPSTVGGPIFLGIYLLLLSFITVVFGLQEKNLKKKFVYFLSVFLFLFVIVISGSRAAYIGLAIGILYFLLFLPRKINWLKIAVILLLLLATLGIYYLNTHLEILSSSLVANNPTIYGLLQRFTVSLFLNDPRFSGWQIAFEALRDRPILGYGPGNFSIGFDKYYDPSLPEIDIVPGGGITTWWDRAHNFIFDIGVTAGIPALIIYLSLFGVLFWQLQKLKRNNPNAPNENPNAPNNRTDPLVLHGIQATFIAYLVANFFSFDNFSTYLISFLLIAYSVYLISLNSAEKIFDLGALFEYRYFIIFPLFLILIWFIWSLNLKPLYINKEVNLAVYGATNKKCETALSRVEKILPTKSYLDGYLRLKYVGIIGECINEKPEMANALALRAVEILKENIKIMPYYTRNWILLGYYTNILIEAGKTELKEEANYYFQKAYELSSRRQEVFIEWIKTDLLTGEYQKAKEKSQKCIDSNTDLGDCWWLKGISEIYLKDSSNAKEDIKTARQKGYLTNSENSLLQLANAYKNTGDFKELVEIYKELIAIKPANAQYYAYLALSYKEVGDYKKARETALKILEIMPEAKPDVDKFLEGLPY